MTYVWPQSRGRFRCWYCAWGGFMMRGATMLQHIKRRHPRSASARYNLIPVRIYGRHPTWGYVDWH